MKNSEKKEQKIEIFEGFAGGGGMYYIEGILKKSRGSQSQG